MIRQKTLAVLMAAFVIAGPCFSDSSDKPAEQAAGRAEARRFLKTWLVDGKIDAATEFLTNQAKVCTPSPESAEIGLKSREEAKAVLREGLRIVKVHLGASRALANAVRPITSLRLEIKSAVHEDAPEFSVMEVADDDLRYMTCGTITRSSPSVMVAAFMFQVPEEETEAMYFVFQQQKGGWRIVAFDRFKQ